MWNRKPKIVFFKGRDYLKLCRENEARTQCSVEVENMGDKLDISVFLVSCYDLISCNNISVFSLNVRLK